MSFYTFNSNTLKLLNDYNLVANTVSWEDTARSKNSCWGPNITDMTLTTETYSCPMIRRPNFNDITYDIPITNFHLLVGNEKGENSKVVSLKEKLEDLGLYLERDNVILTSAQTCVLPCDTEVNFNVKLYNYQSEDKDSRVLTIMACDKGTSIQTLGSKAEKLYFNQNGTAYDFKAERLAEVRERLTGIKQDAVKKVSEMTLEEKRENVIMVFQVPLKSSRVMQVGGSAYADTTGVYKSSVNYDIEEECEDDDSGLAGCLYGDSESDDENYRSMELPKKGVDMAVLSLGKEQGKFKGIQVNKLVRDEKYPIRCTFQYYRLTDKEELEEEVIQDIKHTFDNLEKEAISFGSLVSNTTDRQTEPVMEDKNEILQDMKEDIVRPPETKLNWNNQTMTTFM